MRQRVMIAMALACEPDLLIADEPTTALDVTIQAQILELLTRLREELGLSILLITHDLGVVAEIAQDVVVIYAGRVVEAGDVRSVLQRPAHPYTAGLLASVPRAATANGVGTPLRPIPGMVPDPTAMPPGCAFHARCAHHVPGLCDRDRPDLVALEGTRWVRCLRVAELSGDRG